MDHIGILKRAWHLTWRYKILWLFGLFAGGMGGGGGGGGGGGQSGYDAGNVPDQWTDAERFVEQNPEIIALIVAAIVLFVLVMLVVGVAAQGGIVYLAREAEMGRAVRGRDGWRVGFSKWWRVFAIGLLLGLPMLLLVPLVFLGAVVCCLLPLVIVLMLAAAVVLGVVGALAVRYAVLADRGVIDSIDQGIKDFRAYFKDSLLFYLLLWIVALGAGIAILLSAVILAIPTILLAIAGQWVVAIVAALPALVVGALGTAVANAFFHVAWTLFFMRLHPPEPPAAAFAGVGAPAPAAPPPPPMIEA